MIVNAYLRSTRLRQDAERAAAFARAEELKCAQACVRLAVSSSYTASQQQVAQVLHPTLALIQSIMRARTSLLRMRSALMPRKRRVCPPSLDVESLRAPATWEQSVPVSGDQPAGSAFPYNRPGTHATFANSDLIVDETELTPAEKSLESDACSSDSHAIPDETTELDDQDAASAPEDQAAVSASPQLNGVAVASMIELFDAMYDADAYSLADFVTPSAPREPTTASGPSPSHGTSMAFEADNASPSQARLHAEVCDSVAEL